MMRRMIYLIRMTIGSLLLVPHVLLMLFSGRGQMIRQDIRRWLEVEGRQMSTTLGLIYLMTHFREYRNLFYYRIGPWKYLIGFLCPKLGSLGISAVEVGPGLYIQHGDGTKIAARSIGRNCWINQQVTIGWEQKGQPVIKDNVRIAAGAKVIGKVVVGNNCIIGANAVVVKDVPDNCTVVGVYPAYIIRRDGKRVKEPL